MQRFKGIITKLFSKFHLAGLLILSAFLNIYRLWGLDYGNEYYAAGIKSMLSSFSNFFFLSLDSSGFISVDKPPLSLWVDAIFAKIFGFSGVSILIPHAIEGILVTLLVYIIVKKVAGKLPAFIASLAITLSPVNVAVYRNNTPDALLLVFLLLSVFFILKYIEKQKIRFVLLAGLMVGLGFNTKMMQAFLILPALITAIIIFTKGNVFNKIKALLAFLIITAIVSFSWITIVDLTPGSMRPYVGSSTTNSAWDLAFNYNGMQRLEGEDSVGNQAGFNVGEASLLRLFSGEMGTQTGWLLVSALLFAIYYIIKNFKVLWLTFIGHIKGIKLYDSLMILSIIFMLTGFIFFSYAGFFHSYYLNIFAVPVAIIIGGVVYEITMSEFKNRLLVIILALSIPLQVNLIIQASYAQVLIPVIITLALSAILLCIYFKEILFQKIALALMLIAIFITPFLWSCYTTLEGNTATPIFIGGPSIAGSSMGRPGGDGAMNRQDGVMPPQKNTGNGGFNSSNISSSLVSYLQENNSGEKYFVAVTSASTAQPFILDYNIGNIMTLGGFSGRDSAITLESLKTKINAGEIKFFYLENNGGKFNGNSDITNYISSSCNSITEFSGLYQCRSN